MSRTTGFLVAAALVCSASCARARVPARPGAGPVQVGTGTESADAYYEVMTRYCAGPVVGSRAVVTALATVHGTANGQPVSGRVWVGADYYNRSLRVESDTPPPFILTAERAGVQGDMSDGEGTLYLPGERQIVRRASTVPCSRPCWAFRWPRRSSCRRSPDVASTAEAWRRERSGRMRFVFRWVTRPICSCCVRVHSLPGRCPPSAARVADADSGGAPNTTEIRTTC